MRYRIGSGIVAAFLYNIWVGQYWFNPRLSPAETLISEYANPAEPFSWIFRAADMTVGAILLFLFFSFLSQKSSPLALVSTAFARLHKAALLSWLIFALATLGDAIFPLNCSIEGSVILTGKCVTVNNVVHEITSVMAGLSAIIMILCGSFSFALFNANRYISQKCELLLLCSLGAVCLLSNGYTFLSVLIPLPYSGYAQRLSVLCLSLWWVVYMMAWESVKSLQK